MRERARRHLQQPPRRLAAQQWQRVGGTSPQRTSKSEKRISYQKNMTSKIPFADPLNLPLACVPMGFAFMPRRLREPPASPTPPAPSSGAPPPGHNRNRGKPYSYPFYFYFSFVPFFPPCPKNVDSNLAFDHDVPVIWGRRAHGVYAQTYATHVAHAATLAHACRRATTHP